jgi:hypothetical protein
MGENLKVVGVDWIFTFLPKVVNLAQKTHFYGISIQIGKE